MLSSTGVAKRVELLQGRTLHGHIDKNYVRNAPPQGRCISFEWTVFGFDSSFGSQSGF